MHPLDRAVVIQSIVIDQPTPNYCAGASFAAPTMHVHMFPGVQFTPNVFHNLVVTRVIGKDADIANSKPLMTRHRPPGLLRLLDQQPFRVRTEFIGFSQVHERVDTSLDENPNLLPRLRFRKIAWVFPGEQPTGVGPPCVNSLVVWPGEG